MIAEKVDHRRDEADAEAAVGDAGPRLEQEGPQPEGRLLGVSGERRPDGLHAGDEVEEEVDEDDDDAQQEGPQTEHLPRSPPTRLPETTRKSGGCAAPRSWRPTGSDGRSRGCICHQARPPTPHVTMAAVEAPRGNEPMAHRAEPNHRLRLTPRR